MARKRKRATGWKHYTGWSFKEYAAICPNAQVRRKLMRAVAHAIHRCCNPKDRMYYRYGARGIHIHPEWLENRALFLKHLVTLTGYDNALLDLDRKDNDGHYEPGNLRFVTASVSSQNQQRVQFWPKSTGVTFLKKTRKWRSQWTVKGKTLYFGCYRTKKEALVVSRIKRAEMIAAKKLSE